MHCARPVSGLGLLAVLLITAFPGAALAQEVDWAKRVEDAKALEASGRAAEALEAYKALVAEAPAERAVEVREPMGRAFEILRGAGKLQETEELFRKAVERRPDDLMAASYLAQALQAVGKTGEAADIYRKLGASGGEFGAWALHNLGTILGRDQKTWTEAADAFLSALRGNPSSRHCVDWADHIAGVTNQQRRFAEARRIWLGIGETEGVDPALRSRSLLYAGMIDYRQGRLDEAEPLYRQAIALSPSNAELVNNLALLQLARGDYQAALATLERAIALDPLFPDTLENLTRYWLDRKQPDKARDYASRGYKVALAALEKANLAVNQGRMSNDAGILTLEDEARKARYRVYRFETCLRTTR